eukprot:gene32268-39845_t
MFGNKLNEYSNPNWSNRNWLKSRFHFSFAEYSNSRNTGFGILRVLNDDLVQPLRGFGGHPHRDAEICTYVVDGQLSHKDSMGTQETIGRGAIQFMTAGSGVTHSEHNLHESDPLRFIQIWMRPRTYGIKPNYGSFSGPVADRSNQWAHLVSDVDSEVSSPIKINQDANIFVTESSAGHNTTFELKAGRQAYLLCVEGSEVRIVSESRGVDQTLSKHDAAEVFGPLTFTVSTSDEKVPAHMLMVEMKFSGVGRTDL